MNYKRILAVGDIHGMYEKLINLMEKVQFNPKEDLLIFLGDYIDRGPQSLECVDYVMSLQQQYPERVICLKGNHEAMCSNYYKYEGHKQSFMSEGNDLQMVLVWLDNGGKDTFRQFKKLKKTELQKRLRWMRTLSTYYQAGNYYFCHAGVEPYILLDKQREEDLLWIHKWFIRMYHKNEIIVVGHTPVQRLDYPPVPQFLDNNIILCDTGSFMDDGKLSCVDVLSKMFWQA